MRSSNIKIKSCLDAEYFLSEHSHEVRIKAVNTKYSRSLGEPDSVVFIYYPSEFLGV